MPKTKVLEQYPHPKYPRLIIDRRTNSRFYQARTFLDGKLKQKSTKSDHLPTAFKLGEDWYKREVRSSASFGLQHPIAKLTTDPTIAELFSTYCAELETRKQPYAKQKWSPIAPFWRALLLSTVTSDTFKTFYTWRRREKVKAHTLHKDVVLIRQILKYAIDQNMLDALPRIPSVGTIAKNPRPWFTPQEWHNVAVEDEMGVEELVSTGTFQRKVPHHARVLACSEDPELVTFYDDEKKSS